MLDLGVRWEHRVGTERVSLAATLTDGRRIRDDELQGVLNRLTYVPSQSLLLIHPADREYVQQELSSSSWAGSPPCPTR